MSKRRWTNDQLRTALAASTTWLEVQQRLGLSGRGGSHYNVQRRARELGLDASHFLSTPNNRANLCTDEKLRTVVASSSSFPMVLQQLSLEPGGGVDDKVRRRITTLGLDTSHFKRKRGPRGQKQTRWSEDDLRAAVAGSRSYAQTIRRLGLIPAGGNYDHVQRRIRELAIDTSHFTGMGWNVGGTFKPRPALPIEEVLVANRWTTSHHLKTRLFQEGLKEPKCELCGWAERAADGRIPVELDHINGDRTDNRLVNLRIVCPNCHSLQPTHRGLNQKRAIAARARQPD